MNGRLIPAFNLAFFPSLLHLFNLHGQLGINPIIMISPIPHHPVDFTSNLQDFEITGPTTGKG